MFILKYISESETTGHKTDCSLQYTEDITLLTMTLSNTKSSTVIFYLLILVMLSFKPLLLEAIDTVLHI